MVSDNVQRFATPRQARTAVSHATLDPIIAITLLIVALDVFYLKWYWLAGAVVVFALLLLSFFRDPNRHVPAQKGIMVSPADGDKQFHLLEINCTGIGGFTNLSGEAVAAVLDAPGRPLRTRRSRGSRAGP